MPWRRREEGVSPPEDKNANRFHCCFGPKRRHFRQRLMDLTAMERTGFEPFGEQLVSATDTQPRSRASKMLLRVGTGLFWSLVAGIVLARAAFFEPGVYDGFSRVALLAKSLIF
ncbi:hypothetical protein [Bradyrhizobium sp. USDA 4486]